MDHISTISREDARYGVARFAIFQREDNDDQWSSIEIPENFHFHNSFDYRYTSEKSSQFKSFFIAEYEKKNLFASLPHEINTYIKGLSFNLFSFFFSILFNFS